MKNNWNQAVNNLNKKRFTIPPGWETREQVAEALQCDPVKVPELLKPGIQSGDFEKQDFRVWNEKRRLAESVTCYRIVDKSATTASVAAEDRPLDDKLRARIIAAIKANPGATDSYVARRLYRVQAQDVMTVRAWLENKGM